MFLESLLSFCLLSWFPSNSDCRTALKDLFGKLYTEGIYAVKTGDTKGLDKFGEAAIADIRKTIMEERNSGSINNYVKYLEEQKESLFVYIKKSRLVHNFDAGYFRVFMPLGDSFDVYVTGASAPPGVRIYHIRNFSSEQELDIDDYTKGAKETYAEEQNQSIKKEIYEKLNEIKRLNEIKENAKKEGLEELLQSSEKEMTIKTDHGAISINLFEKEACNLVNDLIMRIYSGTKYVGGISSGDGRVIYVKDVFINFDLYGEGKNCGNENVHKNMSQGDFYYICQVQGCAILGFALKDFYWEDRGNSVIGKVAKGLDILKQLNKDEKMQIEIRKTEKVELAQKEQTQQNQPTYKQEPKQEQKQEEEQGPMVCEIGDRVAVGDLEFIVKSTKIDWYDMGSWRKPILLVYLTTRSLKDNTSANLTYSRLVDERGNYYEPEVTYHINRLYQAEDMFWDYYNTQQGYFEFALAGFKQERVVPFDVGSGRNLSGRNVQFVPDNGWQIPDKKNRARIDLGILPAGLEDKEK